VWCLPAGVDAVAWFAARGLHRPLRLGACTADPAQRSLEGGPLGAAGWQHRIG